MVALGPPIQHIDISDYSNGGANISRLNPPYRTMITSVWYSALRFELDPIMDKGALVKYSDNGVYWLNQGSPTFEADYAALVQRMNYLAKEHSKHYHASSRSIGYSQK